jgi:hypothetical protein
MISALAAVVEVVFLQLLRLPLQVLPLFLLLLLRMPLLLLLLLRPRMLLRLLLIRSTQHNFLYKGLKYSMAMGWGA